MSQLRIARSETKAQRRRRLEAQRTSNEMRTAKLERTRHGGAHDDVALANIFYDLGLLTEFQRDRKQAFRLIPIRFQSRKVENLTIRSREFLLENFDLELVDDPESFHKLLHFNKGEIEDMNLQAEIAESSGQPRKVCKEVFEGLVHVVRSALKSDRRVRLPGLGIIRVKFSPAKPKRKGRNPSNGERMWFKAKPATNKVRFSVAKDLRVYADKKIPVVAPPQKKKKK